MSRSIGDVLIHRFGVSSTPSLQSLQMEEFAHSTVYIVIGSDGLLSYANKEEVIDHLTKTIPISEALNQTLSFAQQKTLEITSGKYADDTSGILISFDL